MDEQFSVAVLRIQIHGGLPHDAVQRLGGDWRNGGVLRIVAVSAPRKPDALRLDIG